MSTIALETAEQLATEPGSQNAPNAAVARSAFYLLSREEPLSAWLHMARSGRLVDHGVVICPSIGFEQLHAARSLRHLADAVATQGIPTLRFDWHGTGDSAGSDADPGRRAIWHHNVRDAVAWMRTKLGCRHVSVVGLRMGAMLAVEALGSDDCDNLVLWAPVTDGKAFMRQMQTVELMAESRPRAGDAAPGDIEAAGFLITEATAEQLTKLSLLKSQWSCLQALIVGPADKRLAERFTQFDIPVSQISPPGYAEMMAEPHFSQVPQQAVQEIAAWLGKRILVPTAGDLALAGDAVGPAQAMIARQSDEATSPWGAIRERLLRIGDVELFGVLSEPSNPAPELPAIVILNAGAASHVGPGRIYVDIARHLAGHGFRCLRLDVCGLGESICADPADENNPYPTTVFRDIGLALDHLRTQFSVERCVVMGLCSGAYAAFQAAAQLSDPALVESILVNPLTFHWEDGMPFDASGAQKLMQDHCRMARATNTKKLWKFVRGKADIGYLDALRLLGRRLKHLVQKRTAVDSARAVFPPAVVGHPTDNNLPADLQRVASARRTLAMFLAENDPGYAVLTYYAPQEAKQWLRSGALKMLTVAEGDHTFSRRAPRRRLLTTLSDYLRERFPLNNSPENDS